MRILVSVTALLLVQLAAGVMTTQHHISGGSSAAMGFDTKPKPTFLRKYQDTMGKGTTFQQQYGYPGAANCTTHWFSQFVDHFSFGAPSGVASPMMYEQKVLVYDKYYKPGGPIFFYAGNEGPITIFTDIAGLMWQNAPDFNAALVFAEHRFFGESQPCANWTNCREHLSTQQAMGDYAALLTNLTDKSKGMFGSSRGVITFGGSYGGMLSAWMRIKYPNLVTGSVASSAPIGMVSESYKTESYWKVITDDATEAGGSKPLCALSVSATILNAFALLDKPGGAEKLTALFSSCTQFPSGAAGKAQFGMFIQAAFDLLGMGDYPFSIGFIFGDSDHPAPAWPMRTACEFAPDSLNVTDDELYVAVAKMVSVVYNVTKDEQCYVTNGNPTSSSTWDYMVCSERVINEQPYFAATGLPNDMFYEQPVWTHARYDAHCSEAYDLLPRYGWLNTTFGAGNVEGATNIVFANGLYDPWHSGGILHNVSATVRSYIIPEGAHHLDLLFTTPADPPGVAFVRAEEMRHVRKWLSDL